MRRTFSSAVMALIAAEALMLGQAKDPGEILAQARAALGGDKLASVKALSASGRTLRTLPNGNSMESDFELLLELPDKYLLHTVIAAMGNMSVYRNTGFNGGQVIEEIDRPPNLSGGNIVIRIAGPGGTMDPEKMTPAQKAEADKLRLLANRKEFARLTLGMLAASTPAFPLEFTYAGQAESPDGRADVIAVKGEGDFEAKLFVDEKSHLPLMLSWIAREPVIVQVGGPGGPGGGPGSGTVTSGGGGAQVMQRVERGSGQPPSAEELEKMKSDMEAKRKEAEAKARMVEYRVYYGDYQAVNGVKLPFKIQRSIDGKPTEEMVFDEFKVNPKIDQKKFSPAK